MCIFEEKKIEAKAVVAKTPRKYFLVTRFALLRCKPGRLFLKPVDRRFLTT